MGREPICYCFQVYREEIVAAIREHQPKTVEELQKYCKASMGCGSCRPDVEKIIAEELTKLKKK